MATGDDSGWTEAPATSIVAGDRIRFRGGEFVVARVDARFLGRENMICFVEHTSERWHAYPARLEDMVEVRRGP